MCKWEKGDGVQIFLADFLHCFIFSMQLFWPLWPLEPYLLSLANKTLTRLKIFSRVIDCYCGHHTSKFRVYFPRKFRSDNLTFDYLFWSQYWLGQKMTRLDMLIVVMSFWTYLFPFCSKLSGRRGGPSSPPPSPPPPPLQYELKWNFIVTLPHFMFNSSWSVYDGFIR